MRKSKSPAKGQLALWFLQPPPFSPAWARFLSAMAADLLSDADAKKRQLWEARFERLVALEAVVSLMPDGLTTSAETNAQACARARAKLDALLEEIQKSLARRPGRPPIGRAGLHSFLSEVLSGAWEKGEAERKRAVVELGEVFDRPLESHEVAKVLWDGANRARAPHHAARELGLLLTSTPPKATSLSRQLRADRRRRGAPGFNS